MSCKRLLLVIAFTVCLLNNNAGAQPAPRSSSPTGLAIEVSYLAGQAPTYQPVPRASAPRGWVWYARFGRVAGWQLPAGTQPIRAVRIVPFLDEEAVRITVSVLRGEKFHDNENTVATYSARENETLTLTALKDFGVEPFEIRVVRVAPQLSDVPTIVNNTRSLEVVGVEPVISTFPVYKITLRNLSDKSISALQVNVEREGHISLSGMPQGNDGEPLIKAGGYFELEQLLPTTAQATPEGYLPASLPAQQVTIVTLVFEDGTYEGETKAAATYRGYAMGRETELKRIVPALESAVSMSDSVEAVRTRLQELSYDFDKSDLDQLAAAFPGIARERLQSPIEASIHGVRRELLAKLERFEQTRRPSGDFQSWLKGIKNVYSNWLSRINSNSVAHR